MAFASCGACEAQYDADAVARLQHGELVPCRCGAVQPVVHLTSTDAGTAHEFLNLRGKRPGKNPYWERKSGDDLNHSTGQWFSVEQTVDQDDDLYSKRVLDPQGNVVRECDEPLHLHRGRGAAKRVATQTDSVEQESREERSL